MSAWDRVDTNEQNDDWEGTPGADAAARQRWESQLQYEHLPKG